MLKLPKSCLRYRLKVVPKLTKKNRSKITSATAQRFPKLVALAAYLSLGCVAVVVAYGAVVVSSTSQDVRGQAATTQSGSQLGVPKITSLRINGNQVADLSVTGNLPKPVGTDSASGSSVVVATATSSTATSAAQGLTTVGVKKAPPASPLDIKAAPKGVALVYVLLGLGGIVFAVGSAGVFVFSKLHG